MTHEQAIALIERAHIYGNPKFAAELAQEILKDMREEAEARLQHADALEAWAQSRGTAR